MRYSLLTFIKDQWTKPIPLRTHDLSGRTAVVLGANTGLGYEAAKHLARMKPGKLVLACRSQERAERAAQSIRKETGYEGVEVQLVDLADFSSVTNFARRFNEKEERLDLLLANAGVAMNSYEPTKDGWETTLQVNHLSTSLLSLLLLPKMISTSRLSFSNPNSSPLSQNSAQLNALSNLSPRLVVVTSETHYFGKFPSTLIDSENLLENLGSKEYSSSLVAMASRYVDTKLLNVFFTRALASRLSPPSSLSPALDSSLAPAPTCSQPDHEATSTPPLTITSVNPGLCHSSIHRHFTNPISVAFQWLTEWLFARSTEVGGRVLVWASLEGPGSISSSGPAENQDTSKVGMNVENIHGQYLNSWRVDEPSDYILQNPQLEDRFWDETIRILTKAEPEVGEIVRRYLTPRPQ